MKIRKIRLVTLILSVLLLTMFIMPSGLAIAEEKNDQQESATSRVGDGEQQPGDGEQPPTGDGTQPPAGDGEQPPTGDGTQPPGDGTQPPEGDGDGGSQLPDGGITPPSGEEVDMAAAGFGLSGGVTIDTPVISPDGGDFIIQVNVSISCATEEATVFYTTNGNNPSVEWKNSKWDLGSGTKTYSDTIPINSGDTTTIKAVACKVIDGTLYKSDVAAATFSRKNQPVLSPPGSPSGETYDGPVDVTVGPYTPGIVFYYTTNGEAPKVDWNEDENCWKPGDANTKEYEGLIPINSNTTLKVKAYKSNSKEGSSGLANETYSISQNTAPIAINDEYTTDEGSILTIASPGVLVNDTDSENDTLTAELVSGPANGSLTFNIDGSFVYTPGEGFSGEDSFTYKAHDGKLYSNDATVTINVNQVSYTLTVNKSGEGEVATTPGGLGHRMGTPVQLAAAAASGWRFVRWEGEGVEADSEDPTKASVIMNGHKAVTAVFEKETTTIQTGNNDLEWQRSVEPADRYVSGKGGGWTYASASLIPLVNPITWDGGTSEQFFKGYSTRSDIEWASWERISKNSTDLRRFKADFFVPEDMQIGAAKLLSVDAGTTIPINDNIYVYVNGRLAFWGGTRINDGSVIFDGKNGLPAYRNKDSEGQYPHTDGWYIDADIDISGFLDPGKCNTIDVFTEEYNTGGGMSRLLLHIGEVPVEEEIYGSLTVTKLWDNGESPKLMVLLEATGIPVTFNLYKDGGETPFMTKDTFWDDETGWAAVFDELPAGSYRLEEVVPDGYESSIPDGYQFEVPGSDEVVDWYITVTNTKNPETPVTYYTLTLSTQGQGSTSPAAGNHSYPEGTQVELTASAASGWRFVRWEGEGVEFDPNNAFIAAIIMNENRAVTAVFSRIQSGGPGGYTTPSETIPEEEIPAGTVEQPEEEPEEKPADKPAGDKELSEGQKPQDEPQSIEIVEDEPAPAGPSSLPKTGGIPASLFYAIGGMLALAGITIRRRK